MTTPTTRPYTNRQPRHHEKCAECSKTIPSTRKVTAIYCSTSCYRTANHRQNYTPVTRSHVDCLCCGKTIPLTRAANAKFCSYSCQLVNVSNNTDPVQRMEAYWTIEDETLDLALMGIDPEDIPDEVIEEAAELDALLGEFELA